MQIDLNRAKRVAITCLAMSSCAFTLWACQNSGHADSQVDNNTSQVVVNSQARAAATVTQGAANQTSTTTVDQTDQGNYGCLDSENIDDQGHLTVTGWHATNGAQNRPYHYIIAYDRTNNQEINRVNVTNEEVERADVARAHNVYGAEQSGFRANFNLGPVLAKTNAIQIISRYTDDQAGNGNACDYWFAPLTVNRNNNASLDRVTVQGNQLELTGWHATNLAADKPYHYVIIVDRTANGREVGRYLVKEPVSRPDVGHAYPDVEGAAQSGFTASFALTNLNLNHQLQVISRYAGTRDGNSDYVDYWFSPITSGSEVNQGHLDGYDLSSGKQLTVTGWHMNGLVGMEPDHFLILFDQTANRQVGQVTPTATNRPDVARAFPNVNQAGRSGFTANFDLSKVQLVPGHTYAVVSRYSTSSQGNGGQGEYTDCWLTPFTLNQRGAAWLDSNRMTNDGLQVTGWMASNQSLRRPYAYVIILNNGKEVGRSRLTLTSRPDVGRQYGQTYNSQQSGFSTLIKFNPAQITGQLGVILRFSASADGNSNYVDVLNRSFASNDGYFDNVTVSPNSLYVSGWHASDQSAGKPYQWLIFIDQNGHELYRQRVLDINNSRPDLANNRSFILNAGQAGFKLGLAIPAQLQHHVVRIIHRYTDDPQGNGNAVDLWSGIIDINSLEQRLKGRWQSIANSFGMPVSIAVQDANTGEVVNYSNVPGQTFIMASTAKVGILTKLLHNQSGNLSAYQQQTAARMIEFSDNDCATELFHEIGRQNGLNQLYQELGMSSTHTDLRWGLTTTTALDQLRLLHEIFLNPASTYLNRQSQQYIQSLMARVTPSQSWGISAGSSSFYIKDGWNTTDAWNVSSIGFIPGKYTIAVYTKNPSFDRCRSFIEQLALATRQSFN